MHELSIARSIISLVEGEAEAKGFQRVLSIRLRVGEYSGLVPQCLEEFFPYAAQGSIAQGAKLEIEPVTAAFRCTACGYEGPVARSQARCPVCGSQDLKMTQGRELYVDSLQVE